MKEPVFSYIIKKRTHTHTKTNTANQFLHFLSVSQILSALHNLYYSPLKPDELPLKAEYRSKVKNGHIHTLQLSIVWINIYTHARTYSLMSMLQVSDPLEGATHRQHQLSFLE